MTAPVGNAFSLEERLLRLEQRVAHLEGATAVEKYSEVPDRMGENREELSSGMFAGPSPFQSEVALESQIGEFWLARVGVLALIVGIGFLVTFPFATLPPLVPCLIGYAAVAGFLGLAKIWRRSLPDASRLLFGGALFLTYFATLRLHFFSAHPALDNRAVALGLLTLVLGLQYFVAFRMRSELTASLVAGLAFVTATVSDTPNFSLGLMLAATMTAVWFYRRLNWWKLTLLAMGLAYLMHLLWLMNNPLAGNLLRGVQDPHLNLFFLAGSTVSIALAGLLRPTDEPAIVRILRAGGNSAGTMFVGLLNLQLFHKGEAHWLLVGLAVVFLAAAIVYWKHHRGEYGTAIYACFGYLALSGAIFAWFPSPDYYGWLGWQSLLVAVTAVWFRSKIIIVTNLFIFGGIYMTYLAAAPASGAVNLSFAIVALLIARILNWQKANLEVRTELMRNVYLGAAMVIIPYGLYHTVPPTLVSISWLVAATVYFIASRVLANMKYRWMGIATIFATIGYVFVVDLSQLEPAYRILSFLVLGVVLIGFSIFYARQRRKEESDDKRGE